MTLADTYNAIYTNGSERFHSVNGIEEEIAIIGMHEQWHGLRILEIGCGEGRLASMLGYAEAERVDGIDYSHEAIDIARERVKLPNVRFFQSDFREITEQYDAVVMQGVLEHFDDPFGSLDLIMSRLVRDGGFCITSSPSFLNPRGYVWMALQTLLNVPMSLTDKHFLNIWDFERFAAGRFQWNWKTIHRDWACGKLLISDFRKRLTNAMSDAGYDNSQVATFLEWLSQATSYESNGYHAGAVAIYRIDKS